MTPCEKLGYKVGDEFEFKVETGIFYKGQKITLSKDDGSICPVFTCEPFGSKQKDGWGVVCLDSIRPLPITLRKGDYCSTANMTEREYHAVAAAFMAAGADEGEYPNFGWASDESILPNFGWYEEDLHHGNDEFEGRHLTPAQIIGAVNAKTDESNMHAFKKGDKAVIIDGVRDTHNFEIGEEVEIVDPHTTNCQDKAPKAANTKGDVWWVRIENLKPASSVTEQPDVHIIDNLHAKRQARDVAEQQYQAALAEVREAYPWIRVEEKSESLPLGEWKAGDILQCSKEEWFSFEKFTVGREYEMRTSSRNVGGRMFSDFIDDEGDSMGAPLDHFTFIRRP